MSAAAALDPVLHFVDSLTPGSALEAAARIDGLPLNQRAGLPLAGVPFLAKAGTTVASPVVGRLVYAGAVLLGTSTRPAPAAVCQAWGWNGHEHTSNQWRTDRSSGGSPAGAEAAVGPGVISISTGGDSAGSLRIPAAFCAGRARPWRGCRPVAGGARLTSTAAANGPVTCGDRKSSGLGP
jgi:amidase